MTSPTETLGTAAREAFARRIAPGRALADAGPTIARACHDLAVRFLRGGTLFAFGNGDSSTDAQHISVEFVHPVVVGKRALTGTRGGRTDRSRSPVTERLDDLLAETA